jgi:hypothetical protein
MTDSPAVAVLRREHSNMLEKAARLSLRADDAATEADGLRTEAQALRDAAAAMASAIGALTP